MKKVVSSPYSLWALLALPAIPIVLGVVQGGVGTEADEVMGAAGALSAFLMIVTLALSPLLAIFPKSRAMAWLMRRRIYFGVASFGYAVVHVILYLTGLDSMAQALGGFLMPAILTGWLAFFILIPLAVTSNRTVTRAMGWRRWKMLQRGVYVAAVLVLAHWVMVEQEPGPALLFGMLALLEAIRIWRNMAKRSSREELAEAVQP